MDRSLEQEGPMEQQIPHALARIYTWARRYWWKILLSFAVTFTVLGLIVRGIIHVGAGKDTIWCKFSFTVSKGGKGDYDTIAAAIKDSPDHSPVQFCILVKKGVYQENIQIGRSKQNLVLMGEGIENTVITSNGSYSSSDDIRSPTLWVMGKGFHGRDFTVINTAGPDQKNAVALVNLAQWSTFYNCRFVGYQATLNAQRGMQFYHSCEILGTKYYIFGDATAYFQNCRINTTQLSTAQVLVVAGQSRTNPVLDTGFVFHQCHFLTTPYQPKDEESTEGQTYLAGSVAAYSRAVVMLSSMDASIGGWLVEKSVMNTVYFHEFNNHRPQTSSYNGTSINSTEAAQFSMRLFLEGGQWIPTYIPYTLDLFP